MKKGVDWALKHGEAFGLALALSMTLLSATVGSIRETWTNSPREWIETFVIEGGIVALFGWMALKYGMEGYRSTRPIGVGSRSDQETAKD